MSSIEDSQNEDRHKLPPDKHYADSSKLLNSNARQDTMKTSTNTIDNKNNYYISASSWPRGKTASALQQNITSLLSVNSSSASNENSSGRPSDGSPQPPKRERKHYVPFIQGTVSAMFGKGVTAPLDRLKILIQTQHPDYAKVGCFSKQNGILKALSRIYKTEGLLALYRGNHVALARHGLHGGLGFYIHDNLHALNLHQKWHVNKKIVNFVIGSCAGVGATIITFPLDTLRVMIATNQGTLRSIYKQYGATRLPVRLYAGCGSGVIGVIPYAGLNFGVRDTLRDHLYAYQEYRRLCFDERGIPGFWTSAMLGFATGVITQFLTYPIEVLKRRRQNSNLSYKALGDELRRNGFKQMYRGFSLNIIRHPICNAMVWAARDTMVRHNVP